MFNENNSITILQKDMDRTKHPSLYKVSQVLCLSVLQDFMFRMSCAKEYFKQTKSHNHVVIRSLEHPNRTPRNCCRESINDSFSCRTCKITITMEEQCVHSIVANAYAYIPGQFAIRHFCRKNVTVSYDDDDDDELLYIRVLCSDNIYGENIGYRICPRSCTHFHG